MNYAARFAPRRLATLNRGDGTSVVVHLVDHGSDPYLQVGLWDRTPVGMPKPARGRTVNLRLDEVPALAGILGQLARELQRDGGRDAGRQGPQAGVSPSPGPRASEAATSRVDTATGPDRHGRWSCDPPATTADPSIPPPWGDQPTTPGPASPTL